MKTNSCSKRFGLSLVAALLLGSGAYAGKIIGVDANASYVKTTPPRQHGFGGWNLDNVDVRMINVDTGELSGLVFNESNGTYDPMTDGDSFRSDIRVDGEIRGILSGKDWPVGEPSGIKVVNDANTTQSEKSSNCIMTTSYLSADDTLTGESGYLDAVDPDPTDCASPFQTHKRFKVSMQRTTVDGITLGEYGKPFELTFNLDDDTDLTVRRYQVFQKINNYTGMRLNGYKIEVLDENGTEVNITTAHDIKFSTIISTKQESDESGDRATFSHGLWGPYEEDKDGNVKFEDGFFDKLRAGFEQVPSDESNTTLVGGPATLFSNYEALFGLWLPYSWAPYGIFHDTDGIPTTDAELVAFWGDPLKTGTNAWHKGNDYNDTNNIDAWELVTEAELDEWNVNEEGSPYSIDKIEDTVNLGLDYVVEVGLNSTIGSKFTIRITPRVAVDQTPPSYIDENGNYILPPQLVTTVPDDTTDDGTTDVPVLNNSDGGSCTFNPNSKGIDTTVLLMLAMGLLYPFRRRFIK